MRKGLKKWWIERAYDYYTLMWTKGIKPTRFVYMGPDGICRPMRRNTKATPFGIAVSPVRHAELNAQLRAKYGNAKASEWPL